MDRQICIQERTLLRGCKILSFDFPEELEIDDSFKFRLRFVNEFVKEDPEDAYLFPYYAYSGTNSLHFVFNRYKEDRTFICQLFYVEPEEAEK